uniref:CCHC-type domain-containing protein n=1 Tax=Brassica oleracea TaxID=3712 RepID=A0A3P6E8E2_BRAOL|nr:unnamed protein product [Brassica oleracea]
MEPAQHGVQDVLNISTEVHVFHRTRLDLDHARLEKDHAILEKDHARLEKDHARLDLDHARLDVDHAILDLANSSLCVDCDPPYLRVLQLVSEPLWLCDDSYLLTLLSVFRMFGLLKKSKPQQDVYFPFKTVFEKEQLIFDKKQFASNGFDFVQKQRNRQNRSDDEKLVRSGDRPFTKAKRSNRDVSNQNELQTYASLEKMLHKAIHVVRQLKKKGNTNTSSAPKQQSNSSSLSNSDLKTNVLSYDKSKAVKTNSKALSTRCFKCHRVGHYANKCKKQKSLPTHSFFLWWLALYRGYIKSHSASLDDPFNPSQFQKCHFPSRIISNTQLK